MHSGSITWDSPVIEYQYSADNTNWHSQEAATDKYRREKQVGGTWKAGYQYKGIDGKPGSNGSDANVPGYIKSTYIDEVEIRSPKIMTNWMYVLPPSFTGYIPPITNPLYNCGYRMFGDFMGGTHEYLTISPYDAGGSPNVVFWSNEGAAAEWNFGTTKFYGNIDFNSAIVKGITAVFG